MYLFTTTMIYLLVRLFYGHKIFGKSHVRKGAAIIAPNHTSFLDPPLVGGSMPGSLAYLARSTLFDIPFLGFLIRHLNAYPISRNSSAVGAFKLVSKLLGEGQKVLIFPEGKRSSDGNLLAFQGGLANLALRSGCPVIPVYIHGAYEIWNTQQKYPKLWGKTACVFGSPISCEPFQHLPKKEAQEALTQKIKEAIENLRNWYLQGAKGEPP